MQCSRIGVISNSMRVFLIVMKCSIEISFSALVVTLQFWLLLRWGTLLVFLSFLLSAFFVCRNNLPCTPPLLLIISQRILHDFRCTNPVCAEYATYVKFYCILVTRQQEKSAEPSTLKKWVCRKNKHQKINCHCKKEKKKKKKT